MSKQLPAYVGFVVLFAVSFLVLNWVYGYVIVFQSETNDCFFMFGRQFLLEFFDHSASLLRYAGRFLGQFYHFRWLGALIVSACITGFGVLFYRVLTKLKGTVHVWQALLPCILLLGLHTSTIYLIHDTLGLLASCGAFLAYLSSRGKTLRRVYALAATPVIYLLLGFYAWLFVAWIVAFEWLDGPLRSGLLFKLGYPVFSIGPPLAAWRWVFPISLRSALVCPIMVAPPFRTGSPPYSPTHVAVNVFLAVVLGASLLVIPFWGRLGKRLGALIRDVADYFGLDWKTVKRIRKSWRAMPGRWRRAVPAVAILALVPAFHVVRYDASFDTFAALRRLYRQGQWDALLEQAKKNPAGDLRVQFMTNFALYQKRRLLDEMFSYPQPWGTRGLVFDFSGRAGYEAMFNSDLFYEMGHVNAAFRHVYNNMFAMRETPDILKRMAECSMVNGNYDMAAKYLNLLERTLFHRGFARRYKAILADPAAAEREFGQLRRFLPEVEADMRAHAIVPFLMLIETRPDNRMAFDYLMAWFLLDKRSIGTITAYIEGFKKAGYASIPAHCQEALLTFERQQGAPVDLRGFRYDEAAMARVEAFFQELPRHRGRPDAPQQMRALFGDTYMYYYYFARAPAHVPAPGGLGGTMREE